MHRLVELLLSIALVAGWLFVSVEVHDSMVERDRAVSRDHADRATTAPKRHGPAAQRAASEPLAPTAVATLASDGPWLCACGALPGTVPGLDDRPRFA